MAFNHVHQPSFVSKEFCNSSVRGRYGDAASEMDNAIGQILKSLTNSGLDNNTIVFFTRYILYSHVTVQTYSACIF
jgi:membrane-anchored protein YejM (alkaline phosphatase superfamily)